MAAIGEEGRKGRFLGLNATTFQPPLPPSSHDVSFDPICKKETFVPKRFSGSPSASLFLFSRTYRGASAPPPSLLPFASSAPFGVFSPLVLLFITRLFRKRKRPPQGHHRNLLYYRLCNNITDQNQNRFLKSLFRMQEYSPFSFFLCSILSRFILFTDARERKEEKWGRQGIVVSSEYLYEQPSRLATFVPPLASRLLVVDNMEMMFGDF